MIRQIVLGAMVIAVELLVAASQHDVLACTTTAGCHSWLLLEDDRMRRDGRMDEAMKAGRENVEAFHALQAAQQNGSPQHRSSARK